MTKRISTPVGLGQVEAEKNKTTRRLVFWFEETEGVDPVRFDHKGRRNKVRGYANCHDRLFVM